MLVNPNKTKLVSYFRQAGTTVFESWYNTEYVYGGRTTGSQSIDTLRAMPYLSGRGGTLDSIALQVTTGGTVGSEVRFGIYTSTSETNIYPDALVVDSGGIISSTSGIKSATISVTLEPNKLYWFAMLVGTAAATFRMPNSLQSAPVLGESSSLGTSIRTGLTVAQTYGPLPATFPTGASFATGGIAYVWVRYSS